MTQLIWKKKNEISWGKKKHTIMYKAEKTKAAAPDVTQTQLNVYNCLFKGIAALGKSIRKQGDNR